MSQITRDKLRLPIGSACQTSQQIKWICIQADCRIHATVPEPIAARFGWPLIVECLINCQAWLHQNQEQNAIHLSVDCWIQAIASEDTAEIFGWRLVYKCHFKSWTQPTWVKLRFPIGSACQVSQLPRVKLRFPVSSACQVSLTRVRLCFLIGSACQVSQIKWCTHDNSKFIHQVYWQVNLGGSTFCFNFFSSIQVYCCLDFYCQLSVDCRPIFESISRGSWILPKHFKQHNLSVDCSTHLLDCRIQPTAAEHLAARFGRCMVIHCHHFNCQPRNFK